MSTQIVVSAIGKDRPGIVLGISKVVFGHGGNITVQRSVKLGGDFAVILMFSVETEDAGELDGILEDLGALQRENLQVIARVATSAADAEAETLELKVSGADHPGIINTLTLFLLDKGTNIHSMDYTVANGPFTAAPMFNATVEIATPGTKQLEELKAGLANVESDLNIDIEVG